MIKDLTAQDMPQTFADDRGQWYRPVVSALLRSPSLKMGTTLAFFHPYGKMLWLIEAWKSTVRTGASSSDNVFRSLGETPSGPVALWIFRPFSNIFTPSVDRLMCHLGVMERTFVFDDSGILVLVEHWWELFIKNVCFVNTIRVNHTSICLQRWNTVVVTFLAVDEPAKFLWVGCWLGTNIVIILLMNSL